MFVKHFWFALGFRSSHKVTVLSVWRIFLGFLQGHLARNLVGFLWDVFRPTKSRLVIFWRKVHWRVCKPWGFQLFSGKVRIVSQTLSGLFLIGAVNRPRERKRTNRENPHTIPNKSEKSWKNRESPQKGQKRTPRLKPPRLLVLDFSENVRAFFLERFVPQNRSFLCQLHSA